MILRMQQKFKESDATVRNSSWEAEPTFQWLHQAGNTAREWRMFWTSKAKNFSQVQHSSVDIFNLKENGGNTGSEAQNQNKLLGGKSQ